ncbi:MAG: hypothetical protein HOV80_11585 [Polyangiaceae bacterium]|nr:hypothetical protein [Polyangiaceae bacterium]
MTLSSAAYAQSAPEASSPPSPPSPPPDPVYDQPDDPEPPQPRPIPRWSGATPTADRLPYRDGKPIPPGYSIDIVPRRGMIAGGAALAGGLHMVSMIAAIALDAEADQTIADEQGGTRTDPEFSNRYTPLFIPLAGPFIAVKTADANGTGSAILIMNGVAQVTGAALVISGLVATKKELVRDDAPISFNVAPMVADGGGGISLEGLF